MQHSIKTRSDTLSSSADHTMVTGILNVLPKIVTKLTYVQKGTFKFLSICFRFETEHARRSAAFRMSSTE